MNATLQYLTGPRDAAAPRVWIYYSSFAFWCQTFLNTLHTMSNCYINFKWIGPFYDVRNMNLHWKWKSDFWHHIIVFCGHSGQCQCTIELILSVEHMLALFGSLGLRRTILIPFWKLACMCSSRYFRMLYICMFFPFAFGHSKWRCARPYPCSPHWNL